MAGTETKERGNSPLEFLFSFALRESRVSGRWFGLVGLFSALLVASFGTLANQQGLTGGEDSHAVSVFTYTSAEENVCNYIHFSEGTAEVEQEENRAADGNDIPMLGSDAAMELGVVSLALSSPFRSIILLDERNGMLREQDRPPARASLHALV